MNKQSDDAKNDPSLLLEWELPVECKTKVKQTSIPLNGSIVLRNEGFEFKQLSVEIKFSSFDANSNKQNLRFNQLKPRTSLSLELPPVKNQDTSKEFTISTIQSLEIAVFVEADGKLILDDRRIVKLLPPAELLADVSSVYSVVFQQNQFPLISRLNLINQSIDSFGLTRVVAKFDPPEFDEVIWNIDVIAEGQSVRLQEQQLKLSAKALEQLHEKRLVSLKLSVYNDDVLIFEAVHEIELLPKNHWGGELHMPELLSAFVTPNIHYCDVLLKKASNLLLKDGYESKFDGYKSNTRDRPYMVAAALWSVLCGEGISYCVPPASFAKSGQKVRLGSDISTSLLATCLDLALLFASCLEQAGLNCVIALTKGHAMVGVWLIDECFSLVTCDDPVDLRNRIALKDLILFETTLATNDHPIQFAQAIREADRKIAEEVEDEFVYVIDVKQARSRKISPIDFETDSDFAPAEKSEREEVELPPAPLLPPVVQQTPVEEMSPSDRVDQWRRKLLDLSKRNKLLNIRQRSMGFRIICPDIDQLEDELASGKKFNILPKDKFLSGGRSEEQYTIQTGNSLTDEFVRDQLCRGSLIADSNERDLEKNLINLFRRAKSDLEESGSNTLFLAVGMLRWKEDDRNDQFYKAPLILLPVRLERTSARAKPKIMQLPDEDAVFNLTLIEFLFQDFEIDLRCFQRDLPRDASGVDVRIIWNTVRSKIKGTPGFGVDEELVLSNFSFAKYLMWKDLSDRIDDLKQSPFVNHLVEKPTDPYPFKADFINPDNVDEKMDPCRFYVPLNADSSQMVAIDASSKGVDFVLEGPPGTGKSETIANIIAHNMALGRKVLFVSEKMAALDVVYSRLKKVGLGHLCLELHSNKASKIGVMDQLSEAWQVRESSSEIDWERKARELGKLRQGLNQYVEELHRKSHLGYSPYEAIAYSVRHKSDARINLEWPMELATALVKTEDDVKHVLTLAKDLGLAFKDISGVEPESFFLVEKSEWSPIWQSKLIDKASELKTRLSGFQSQLDKFLKLFGLDQSIDLSINASVCWAEIARCSIASKEQSHSFALAENAKELLGNLTRLAECKKQFDNLLLSTGIRIDAQDVCDLPVKLWVEQIEELEELPEKYRVEKSLLSELKKIGFNIEPSIEELSNIGKLMSECDCSREHESLVDIPVFEWIKLRDSVADKNVFVKFVVKRKIFRQIRLANLKKVKNLEKLDQLAQLIETIVSVQYRVLDKLLSQVKALVKLGDEIKSHFICYEGDGILDQWNSTSEQILERKEYGTRVRQNFMEADGQLSNPDEFMQTVRKKILDEHDFMEKSLLFKQAEKFWESYQSLSESALEFESLAESSEASEVQISELQNKLSEIISSAPDLNAWCHWVGESNKARVSGLSALVQGLENGLINWDETENQLEIAICTWLAPLLVSHSSVLCQFRTSRHNDLIQQFRALDEEVASTTGQFIAAKLAAEMPETSGPNAPHEYGVLSRELQRQRGHKPVRQLIQELGGYLLDLTPCFMMSPLSVAQYLPSDYQAFDLVVFDEASQITVWDAVGAIARGKQVIVVGDPKQMPPTSFFNKASNDGDGDEADLESILDQAMATRVTHHRLTGHYRSRHESLITFSNHQYYNNTLITYPSADTRDTAITWHRVDGLYSKGKERNNLIEAQAVVAEVVRRLKDPQLQKLSIGIVTFNSEQQQLIENLLDDERRKDKALEPFFGEDSDEPVFVKNLETVQGDQRDVICLSVGYGPTEPGAQAMSMTFGPLNRQGGERRLNVAITRASTEMLVFSSFDASMIDLSRTSAQAVKDLRAYIDYAARGPVAIAQQTNLISNIDRFDSEFEEAVAIRLREKGWQLRTQVGVSKFRIDLGVLNPDFGGSFLAGIECDGASYHSSPSARDRDRVRHIILNNLGWKLIRIWSTDYFIDPYKVIEQVHLQIKELLQVERESRRKVKEERSTKKETVLPEPLDVLEEGV